MLDLFCCRFTMYRWPLNNTRLNCVASLTGRFFNNKYYSTTQSMVGQVRGSENLDGRRCIGRGLTTSQRQIFSCAEGGHLNPVAQGSTVYLKNHAVKNPFIPHVPQHFWTIESLFSHRILKILWKIGGGTLLYTCCKKPDPRHLLLMIPIRHFIACWSKSVDILNQWFSNLSAHQIYLGLTDW